MHFHLSRYFGFEGLDPTVRVTVPITSLRDVHYTPAMNVLSMTLWSNLNCIDNIQYMSMLNCFQTLNMSSAPLIVSKEEVEELLNPRDLLNRLENAFGRVANGTNSGIQQPVRTVVTIDKYQGQAFIHLLFTCFLSTDLLTVNFASWLHYTKIVSQIV